MSTKQLNNVKILFDTNIDANRVLMKGEIGFEMANNRILLKVGDGKTAFSNLPYFIAREQDECGNEIKIFNRGVCIGDDTTAGVINNSVHKHTSYPSVLKKLTGADIVNAGIASVTASQWVSASINSSSQNGTWDENNEWVYSSSTSTFDYGGGYDFAIINLGFNDAVLGFNADRYLNSISTIINKLYTENPSIKIFLCTLSGTLYDTVNECIRNNYSSFPNTYLIDLAAKSNGYSSALGYTQLANDLYELISASIKENAADYTTLADNTPSTIVYSGGNSVDNINTVLEEDVDVLLEKEV